MAEFIGKNLNTFKLIKRKIKKLHLILEKGVGSLKDVIIIFEP